MEWFSCIRYQSVQDCETWEGETQKMSYVIDNAFSLRRVSLPPANLGERIWPLPELRDEAGNLGRARWQEFVEQMTVEDKSTQRRNCGNYRYSFKSLAVYWSVDICEETSQGSDRKNLMNLR